MEPAPVAIEGGWEEEARGCVVAADSRSCAMSTPPSPSWAAAPSTFLAVAAGVVAVVVLAAVALVGGCACG